MYVPYTFLQEDWPPSLYPVYITNCTLTLLTFDLKMAVACFHETVISTTHTKWCHSEEATNLGYFMQNKEKGGYMEHTI
jgi:hypothetical protein